MEPKILQLKVNLIILQNTVARGANYVQQVRRRYLSFDREEGEEVVRIKGNVHKKTMQGRAAQPSAYRLTIYRYAIIVSFSKYR